MVLHYKVKAGTCLPMAEMVELSISASEKDMMSGWQFTLGIERLSASH